jgi:hypothetical protein
MRWMTAASCQAGTIIAIRFAGRLRRASTLNVSPLARQAPKR